MTVPAQRIYELYRDADRDDPTAREILARIISQYESTITDGFNMVAIARQFLADELAGPSQSNRAMVEAWFEEVVRNLRVGGGDEPLEQLLVEITTVNYLAAMTASVIGRTGGNQKEVAFRSKMADKSNKRLHTSVDALRAYRLRSR